MQESNKSFDSTQFEVNGSRFKQGYYDTSIKWSMTIWSSHFETEILVLDNNRTWNVVLCPPFVKPIGSKWVFSIKLCYDGFVDCYKAQLVVLATSKSMASTTMRHSHKLLGWPPSVQLKPLPLLNSRKFTWNFPLVYPLHQLLMFAN